MRRSPACACASPIAISKERTMELDELRRAFDGATPSVDIDRARDGVGRRVRRMRTRRRIASGGALLVLLAVLLGGVMTAARDDRSSKVVVGGGGVAPTTPHGASVPLAGSPSSVVFVSRTRGYGVVSTCAGVESSPVCEINVGV